MVRLFIETSASASPPDVRNGCALPQTLNVEWATPSLGTRGILPWKRRRSPIRRTT